MARVSGQGQGQGLAGGQAHDTRTVLLACRADIHERLGELGRLLARRVAVARGVPAVTERDDFARGQPASDRVLLWDLLAAANRPALSRPPLDGGGADEGDLRLCDEHLEALFVGGDRCECADDLVGIGSG